MSIRCITFDLDDTLWHLEPTIRRAEALLGDWIERELPRVAEVHDADTLLEHRRAFYAGLPELHHDVTALRRRWLGEIARSFDYPESLADDGFAHFQAARNDVDLFEHVPGTLGALAEMYQLGVITNGNADVHAIGIGHHFEFVITAASAGACKPDRGIFEAALAAAGAAPEETVHVGDDPARDVAGAQALGVRTVWVNPFAAPWPGGPRADAEVAGIDELQSLLEGW